MVNRLKTITLQQGMIEFDLDIVINLTANSEV
jgi:hypothetical protein